MKDKLINETTTFLEIKLKMAIESMKFWASFNDSRSSQMIKNAENEIVTVQEILNDRKNGCG